MHHPPLIGLSAFISLFAATIYAAPTETDHEIPTALSDYVSRPDSSFSWKIRDTLSTPLGRVWDVELTSQTWQGIVWKHDLIVAEPTSLRIPLHMLLMVAGGSTKKRATSHDALLLASLAHARVAVLHQVPNQPLLDGRKEDDLITETWLKYLATGDVSWVLQLPMVKSVVRAMDALESLAKQEWNSPIAGFVVTGASKRGWTTWLTAVVDKRPIAIAPMVIDMLNLQTQIRYQAETWGKYSEQIEDYGRKNLLKVEGETPRESYLRRLVDPYTYRQQLTLPKLLLHGTNDRYWVVDAAKLYWDGLVGPKYLHEVPNAGHGLEKNREAALSTLVAFFQHVALGTPWPDLKWAYGEQGDDLCLRLWASQKPQTVRLWTASSPTRDLRESAWTSRPIEEENDAFIARIPKPKAGCIALFGEAQFTLEGSTFSLCTLVQTF